MKFPILGPFDAPELLAKTMIAERAAHNATGYFFDFGCPEDNFACVRASVKFHEVAREFMRGARFDKRGAQLFKNLNGQIAVRFTEVSFPDDSEMSLPENI